MKKDFFKNLKRKIARTLLKIRAIRYESTGDPIIWACKLPMRNYNDSRKLLYSYKQRWRVTMGFSLLVGTKKRYTHVLGVSTAGIAPAALYSHRSYTPLLINMGDYFLRFHHDLWFHRGNTIPKEIQELKNEIRQKKVNCILAYKRETIPYGIQLAHIMKLPFAYIREAPKDHGLKKPVEGILPKNLIPMILFDGDFASKENVTAVFPEGEDPKTFWLDLSEIKVVPYLLAKLTDEDDILVIEELISTGGSSALEVEKVRRTGAQCNKMISIYDYGFETARNQFAGRENITGTTIKLDPPCETASLLMFDEMYAEMERTNHFTPEIREKMKEEVSGFDERFQETLVEKV